MTIHSLGDLNGLDDVESRNSLCCVWSDMIDTVSETEWRERTMTESLAKCRTVRVATMRYSRGFAENTPNG